ncbi:MAG: hypothetical protein JSR49_10975 [Proteobacteria bacterium]|nr:hypothetical protein [Pseudomonadota bacterium]
MTFHVPPDRQGFCDDVIHRFRQLLHKGIITGIDPIRLNNWLANFVTDEDRYVAAHLLNGLTYRSDAMVKSSFQHLAHCELPQMLRTREVMALDDLESFDRALCEGDDRSPIRFVAVDGTFEKTPGKSGAVVIRAFKRHLNVSKALLCRPERLAGLPTGVKALIFIDDLVGTGQQFETFASHYDLASHAKQRTLVYCPLLAFNAGLTKLARALPWLEMHPVESLDESHQFFRACASDPTIWGADKVNKVQDVRDHVADLCGRNAIPSRTKHGLDLVVAFEHAVPNNSVSMLSIKSARWQPLFDR